eukprot:CAMPEP_0194512864 /NCGR_PEP_ID=MMETSP0253-20130528/45001_1 /TAXON_ID=2966 /ORGANISM="Noctiluca scintillans" /LENGTH=100 /DNA_ID=CAMNT_0039356365 /DNA_START=139 /DNA_END=438 /DNA_ORIENTATION=+
MMVETDDATLADTAMVRDISGGARRPPHKASYTVRSVSLGIFRTDHVAKAMEWPRTQESGLHLWRDWVTSDRRAANNARASEEQEKHATRSKTCPHPNQW